MSGKAVRLTFIGAAEDIPRRIGAHVRTSAGEFALVLRPLDSQGALIVVLKNRDAAVWTATMGRDSPLVPTEEVSAERALAIARSFVTDTGQPGPIRLRGQWSGSFTLEGNTPRVALQRRIASYGTLRVESHGRDGWRWSFQRSEGWFTKATTTEGGPFENLERAIEGGIKGAMGLVKEACSFRDTRRRAAHDSAYADKHPIKAPKDGTDPTQKVKSPPPKPERKAKPEKKAKAERPKPEKAAKPAPPPKPAKPPKQEKPMRAERPASKPAPEVPAAPPRGTRRKPEPAQANINPEWDRQLTGAIGDVLEDVLSRMAQKE